MYAPTPKCRDTDYIDFHASNSGLYEFTRTAAGLFDRSAYHLLDLGVTSYAIAGNGNVIDLETTGSRKEFLRISSNTFDAGTYKLL
jgi:hypothetical protein